MELYRSVAQKHGRILATLKGIEKERTESQLLKYWTMILESKGQHKLILIPREHIQKAKKWIESNNTQSNTNTVDTPHFLYWFESLTFRSLQKLCFGHAESGSNEFNKNIQHLLPEGKDGQPIRGEYAFEGNEQEKIKFYQEVLKDTYTRSVLHLPFNQIDKEISTNQFQTLEEFRIALEKICYRRFKVFYNNPEQELKENFNAQIFAITSSDLQRQSDQSEFKRHTQLWKQFWDPDNERNAFDIRLNPEITITYRLPKESRIHKYGKDSALYDPNKKNRYLYPQFTLMTTISEHCLAPARNLSFMSDEEFEKSVKEFNNKITNDSIKFAIGIDNGEVQLASLGIYLPAFNER